MICRNLFQSPPFFKNKTESEKNKTKQQEVVVISCFMTANLLQEKLEWEKMESL